VTRYSLVLSMFAVLLWPPANYEGSEAVPTGKMARTTWSTAVTLANKAGCVKARWGTGRMTTAKRLGAVG